MRACGAPAVLGVTLGGSSSATTMSATASSFAILSGSIWCASLFRRPPLLSRSVGYRRHAACRVRLSSPSTPVRMGRRGRGTCADACVSRVARAGRGRRLRAAAGTAAQDGRVGAAQPRGAPPDQIPSGRRRVVSAASRGQYWRQGTDPLSHSGSVSGRRNKAAVNCKCPVSRNRPGPSLSLRKNLLRGLISRLRCSLCASANVGCSARPRAARDGYFTGSLSRLVPPTPATQATAGAAAPPTIAPTWRKKPRWRRLARTQPECRLFRAAPSGAARPRRGRALAFVGTYQDLLDTVARVVGPGPTARGRAERAWVWFATAMQSKNGTPSGHSRTICLIFDSFVTSGDTDQGLPALHAS